MAPISTGASSSNPKPEDELEKAAKEVVSEAKSVLERYLGDVSKASASQQLLVGTASGWCTGMVAARIGKMAAFAVGGGIIALQVAHANGYININWEKLSAKVDKVVDKMDDKKPGIVDKMERFVDKKLDKAEELLKDNRRKVKTWYNRNTGDAPEFQVSTTHIFLGAFILGLAIARKFTR